MIRQRCRYTEEYGGGQSSRYRYREGTIVETKKSTYRILWDGGKNPQEYYKGYIQIVGEIEDDAVSTMSDKDCVELLLTLRKEYWIREAPTETKAKTVEALERGIVRLGGRKALDRDNLRSGSED